MPKSSSTSRTPRLCRRSRLEHDRRRHAEQHGLGQLEATATPGCSPPARSAPATTSSRSGCATWRAERLTEIQPPVSATSSAPGAARVLEHPRADRDDQARLLGDRDEVGGPDLRARRAASAAAPRGRRSSPVGERHDRLEDELELARARARPRGRSRCAAARPRAGAAPRRTARRARCRAPSRGRRRRRRGRSARRGRCRRRCRARCRCSRRAGARCRRRRSAPAPRRRRASRARARCARRPPRRRRRTRRRPSRATVSAGPHGGDHPLRRARSAARRPPRGRRRR